jgi:cytochrome P450
VHRQLILGPHGYPLLGVFPRARRDPLGFFIEANRAYGDVVALPLGPRRLYLLCHPDHVKNVFQDHESVFHKRDAAERIRPLFGDSLTTVDGDDWHRRRSLMRPAFAPPRAASFVPLIARATETMLERWREPAERRRPFDVFVEMTELTRAIIRHALFGEVPTEEARAVGAAIGVVAERVNRGLWSPLGWLPRFVTSHGAYDRAVNELDAFVARRITDGRRRDVGSDLLSTLRAARDAETGVAYDDSSLRDELKALFVAGHVTSASGLAWIWYLLARNEGARRRLQHEIRSVLAARAPTAEDFPHLEYTRMVIDESLRLYPPTWVTARTTTEAVEVGGYRLPAGATVLLSPYVTHRHPRFWEDPERFEPERFSSGHPARPRYAYFPFGGGPRACIGSVFALMEMQVIVAMVTQRYELDLAPGWRVEPAPLTVLAPRHGVGVVLQPVARRA